jgi:ABC-type sugar transport system permease subunit
MSTKFFYAVVLALATIVLQLLLYFSGFQTEKLATGQYLQWLGFVIMAVVLYLGIKAVRDEKPGRAMTYGQRVGTGVLISLYAALMGAAYSFIHFTFINTGFADYVIAMTREKWATRGLTQAQMEGAEAITRKMLQPGVQALMGVIFGVLIGVVLSLIIAALVKDKARPATDAAASAP